MAGGGRVSPYGVQLLEDDKQGDGRERVPRTASTHAHVHVYTFTLVTLEDPCAYPYMPTHTNIHGTSRLVS